MMIPDSDPNRNDNHYRTREGERRRDDGAARAARNRRSETLRWQARAIRLAMAGRDFTVDDLSTPAELRGMFASRAPHRGAVFLALSQRGLIAATGERRRSVRPHRHAGSNAVWRAAATSAELQTALSAISEERQSLAEQAAD